MTDESSASSYPDAVAIVGLAGRFPGAPNVEAFWQNLRDGVESIRPLADEELVAAGVDPALLSDPTYVKRGSVLDGIERFDAGFFGYTAREAALMDPQHRVFLECAWEALERAGYAAEQPGRVGVFAGAGMNTYLFNLINNPELLGSTESFEAVMGNAADHLATRVSYKLNLRGPSLTVQCACSTSLVAVHLACQSLLNGECDLALAGGVSINLFQRAGYQYREGMIFSPDGRCRAFDAEARGTVSGSGAGLVVLKRLAEAAADGDRIVAVIRGSAINNDGSAKVGYTAPSVDGQAEVLAEALAVAGVEPETVAYVEAHGTGTPLGDPIEVAALRRAYGDAGVPCVVGALKTNVGHLDAAAGVAGLIKAALAVREGVIPPTVHFQRPNPSLELGPRFRMSAALSPLTAGPSPRRAAVSSFGIGGTNAHAVLEEAPPLKPGDPSSGSQILPLSARTPEALEAATARLGEHLTSQPELDLADVAYTLQVGRRPFRHRRALVAASTADAAATLTGRDPKRLLSGEAAEARSVAFLFPGQGSQAVGMGRGLYEANEVFRETLDACADRLRPALGLDLREALFPAPDADVDAAEARLRRTSLAQPALFAVEYATAKALEARGVLPSAMLGHSLGEYVAACLAGVFSPDDALDLVAERGRLMESMPPGAMLAVPLPEAELIPMLGDGLDLAGVNGPKQCVASGPEAAVEALSERLQAARVRATRLRTSHAFHSAMMEPILDRFRARVARVRLRPPTRPYVSNLTGTWITPEQATDPEYWVRHLRGAVRFADGATALLETGAVLLEVGPGRALGGLARQSGGPAAAVVSTLGGPEADDSTRLDAAVGRLWLGGATVDWSERWSGQRRLRVELPTYPFERQTYWIERVPSARAADAAQLAASEAPGAAAPAVAASTTLHPRPALTTAYAAPRNDLEATIAELWQELLGIGPVGVYDDFLELGGHSLLATQLASRLRETFPVELELRAIFATQTIAELAEVVENALIDQLAALSDEEILAAEHAGDGEPVA